MSKKFLSVFLSITVTVWLLGGIVVMPVKAATVEELQAQINALLAQIQVLQAQLAAQQGQQTVGSLTKDLYKGLKDPEVSILQQGLKKDSSVYPEGLVTGYFGSLTEAAVKRFQAKYGIPQVGRVGPMTRAKFNELYGGAPSQPSQPPSQPPAVGTGLSVSLAADTPAAGTIIADSLSGDGAQALANVLKLNFKAGSDGAVKVKTLKITRGGISTDADIANAYLADDSGVVAEMSSISNKVITFSSSDKLFEVPAGQTKSIMVKIDLVNGASSGKTITLSLASASDVVTDGASVSGTFPMTSNVMSTASVADLGKLDVSHVSSPSVLDAGATGMELWRFSMAGYDQKIAILKVKLEAVGTIPVDAFDNLELRVDGEKVSGGAGTKLESDKSVTFDLSAKPVEIGLGQTRNFSLVGDVVKGSGRTFYFRITSRHNIVAKDLGYDVYIKPNQADVWQIVYATTETSINQGTLTVDKATDTPSGNVRLSATNVLLGKFYMKASGEDIKVSSLKVNLNKVSTTWGNVTNLKVMVDGGQIGTTVTTADGATDYSFNAGNTLIIHAGETKYVYVYADLIGSNLDAGDKIRVDLINVVGAGLRMSTGTTFDVPGSTKSANELTITAGALSTSKNQSVANMTLVKGSPDVVIGSWLITAPADQGVRINTIKVVDRNAGDTGNGANGLGAAFDALRIYYNNNQVSQIINSPSATAGTVQTFSLSSPISISAGQSVQIDLKASVLTNATWNNTDAVKVTEVSGTGIVTNSTLTDSTGAIGQQITLATAGTLTVAVEASPTNPYSQYLVAGDTEQVLGAFKFSADNSEDVRVTRIKLFATSSAIGNIKNIGLYVDGSLVGSKVPSLIPQNATYNGYALFEATDGLFTVFKNNSRTVVVKADITDKSNATFNDDGQLMKIALNMPSSIDSNSDISAKGALSGQYANVGGTTGYKVANEHKVVKTKPTFALVPMSNPKISAANIVSQGIIRFTISAHSSDDVVFSGTSNIRFTIASTKSNITNSRTFSLYDASSNTKVATDVSISPNNGATIDFSSGLNVTIPKGTSKTFLVVGDLSDYTGQYDSFSLSINNAAADFSWSDNSSPTADIEDDNYYGLGLPLGGQPLTQ